MLMQFVTALMTKSPSQVTDTGEIYDCAIVGGGFSGLSAALFFQQRARANRNCIVLDNAEHFWWCGKAQRVSCRWASSLCSSGICALPAPLS